MPDRARRCRPLRRIVGVFPTLACALLLATTAAAQPPPIQYVYDALGRLVAVADRDGNAAIYVYDAVGNILAIQRVDAANLPGQVAITFVSPGKGKPGTVVSILGKGFGATAAQNAVSFNGTAAVVSSAAANRIVATVPAGATTGPIAVTAPLGSATSPQPFRVLGDLAVAPTTASLGTSATQQFDATAGGAATTNVTWAVNGVVGGDPGVGTISAQGLYTAPATIAALQPVTVSATSKDDAAVTAAATVTLRPPVPAFASARPVGVQVSDPGLRAVLAPGVGVQRSPDASGLTVVASQVGVSPPQSAAFSGASLVSVSRAPLVSSVSPATAARGTTNLTLTLTGSDLAGAISLDFLRNNAPDSTITVTNLTASPDGTQATAVVSIASSSPLEPRVVRIQTPAGTTTSVGAGGNVFTVQ